MTMMLIGVDPHKSTSTATAVEPESNREVASIRIEATLREYRRLLTWAGRWPQRRWAIENAEGLGRHLASWLLARGEQVVDVPATATARVRQLSRGGGRKNDRIGTCLPPRPREYGNSPAAAAGRTTESTPPRPRAWRRCRAMPARCRPREPRMRWRCWTNGGPTCRRPGSGR